MATVIRRNIALVIEGIGSSTASSGGIAWQHGNPTIGTPGVYEWVGGTGTQQGLIGPPQSVSVSVNPFDCSLKGNAHTFRLHGDDLAKQLFYGRPERPRGVLSAAIEPDDTTVALTAAGYTFSASDDGTVVWVGDEAILLGSNAAGPQFTGCTRGYYGTTAQTQPIGMNVYGLNPKVINRLAKVILYDRDEGTTEQAWQGFVESYKLNNGVLSVACRDIWSAVAGAPINRKSPGDMSQRAFGFASSTQQQVGDGNVEMRDEGKFRRRVNKKDATKPHWVALQVAGAAVFGKFTSSAAAFVDATTDSSEPVLGSQISEDEATYRTVLTGAGGIHELMVIDRYRDQEAGSNVTYENMRSSTRDLSQPFHPVAVSMAILTSGYDTVPANTSTAQTEAGAPADLSGPTKLFTTSGTAGEWITGASGKHITNGAVIARRIGQYDTHDMYRRIGSDLTIAWSNAKTNLGDTSAELSGGPCISPDGTKCWVLVTGDGTEGGVANNFCLAELDMADGTINWVEELDHGGDTQSGITTAGAIAYDATNGHIYAAVSASGDELKCVADTGTKVATSGNDSTLGNLAAIALAPDDSVVVGAGASEYVGKWSTPLSGTATAIDGGSSNRTNVDGTDTTLAFSQVRNGDDGARIEPSRDGSDNTVWLVGGYSSADDPYLMEYDPDEATATARVITEVNVSDDTGLTDSGTAHCPDVAIDKAGQVYVLYVNANTGSGATYDVIRYDADGTKDIDFRSVGGLTFMDPSTYGLASRIAVDESFNVMVFTRDGYGISYSQTG